MVKGGDFNSYDCQLDFKGTVLPLLHCYKACRVCLLLTDGGEDTCEAEVIHRIKGKKMIEELLPLFLTAQEGITLVQFPAKHREDLQIVTGTTLDQINQINLVPQINYEPDKKIFSLPRNISSSTSIYWYTGILNMQEFKYQNMDIKGTSKHGY